MTRSFLAMAICLVLASCQTAPRSQPSSASNAPASVQIPEPEAEPPGDEPEPANDVQETPRGARVTPSGLKIEELKRGSGDEAVPGRKVSVHYHGTLSDGTVFDSSRTRNQPFVFNLGGNQVIKGFEEGVTGMKVGDVRRLTIPPELGYGSSSPGKIPANSTLIFEIELLEVK
jgi:FKBP-type peptidyl-prolyl cis-trans isomerase